MRDGCMGAFGQAHVGHALINLHAKGLDSLVVRQPRELVDALLDEAHALVRRLRGRLDHLCRLRRAHNHGRFEIHVQEQQGSGCTDGYQTHAWLAGGGRPAGKRTWRSSSLRRRWPGQIWHSSAGR